MAKRTTRKATPKVEETQEMPAAAGTGDDVIFKDLEESSYHHRDVVGEQTLHLPEPTRLPPDTELQWIINEDTGELRQVTSRAGYAPTPMPFGFRLARNDEVPGK